MAEPLENVDITSLKDEFLECPVCVEYYNHINRCPRLLKNCLHALCTECLDQLIQKEGRGQLTCPLCRHVVKVKGKASSLPADPVRSKLVDFLNMKQQKKIKCTNCPDGNNADGRCYECQSYLCKVCINAHNRNHLSRDHNISSIEDALNVPIREFSQGHFCPKHPKHHIEFYCSTDEELCCVSCTIVDHKGHDFEKIQDAAVRRKTSIQESLKDQGPKTKTDLQQCQKSTKAKRNAVEQMKKESDRSINKMIDDMKLQLDQRRNQLLSELQQESSAMLSVIEKSSAAYATTLAIIESTDTYFTQTKEKADDVEMLQMYPAIKRSVDALTGQPVADDVRINEERLKFSPTQKTTFDGLVSNLGAFERQDAPPQAVQRTQAVPRTMTVTQQDGCTVAQGKTLTLKLYKGDIRTLTTDVIVREVDQKLSPWHAASRYVSDTAGPELPDELVRIRREEGPAPPGSVVVTDAGRLPCKKIFNFVSPYDAGKGVTRCLCEAVNRKLSSIAFPWNYFMIPAVRSFDLSVTEGSLQEVHIVSEDNWQFSGRVLHVKEIWHQISKVEKEDTDVIREHLNPSSGASLSNSP